MSDKEEKLDRLTAVLLRGDKSPFVRELARALISGPTDEAIAKQAERSPLQHAQMLKHLTHASGLLSQEHVHRHTHRMEDLGDMELQLLLTVLHAEETRERYGAYPPGYTPPASLPDRVQALVDAHNVVDAEAVEVPKDDA